MSISIDSRLLVFKWSISELSPMKTKGHPERASASNREKGFSINALSRTPIFWAASVIHSRDLLLGLIIVDVFYNLFNLFLTIAARGIS